MPTLCFDDSFSKMERTILSKTFRNNCKVLGCSGRDATICVRRAPIGSRAHLGAITKLAPDYYVVLINRLNDLCRAIFCLGHEMVHFDQYSRGDLIDAPDGSACFWRGHRFEREVCDSMAAYDDLPWEQEAQAKHDMLMDSALHTLDRQELYEVFPEYALAA